jgi:hypothetical protein
MCKIERNTHSAHPSLSPSSQNQHFRAFVRNLVPTIFEMPFPTILSGKNLIRLYHLNSMIVPQTIDIVDMAIQVGGSREGQSFVWKI